MKLLGTRQLSVLLVGTLLLCHGVFGALHLVCDPLEWCAGGAEHAAEHQAAGGAMVGEEHEHPAGHGTSTEYFAVLVVGLLGLLLGLLPEGAPLRIRLDARWPVILRRLPAVLSPPPTPAPPTLQVFRL
jgi:hypothetical protein